MLCPPSAGKWLGLCLNDSSASPTWKYKSITVMIGHAYYGVHFPVLILGVFLIFQKLVMPYLCKWYLLLIEWNMRFLDIIIMCFIGYLYIINVFKYIFLLKKCSTEIRCSLYCKNIIS